MPYGSFEDLEVWKHSCRTAVWVYELLKDCRDIDRILIRCYSFTHKLSYQYIIPLCAPKKSPLQFLQTLFL